MLPAQRQHFFIYLFFLRAVRAIERLTTTLFITFPSWWNWMQLPVLPDVMNAARSYAVCQQPPEFGCPKHVFPSDTFVERTYCFSDPCMATQEP